MIFSVLLIRKKPIANHSKKARIDPTLYKRKLPANPGIAKIAIYIPISLLPIFKTPSLSKKANYHSR